VIASRRKHRNYADEEKTRILEDVAELEVNLGYCPALDVNSGSPNA